MIRKLKCFFGFHNLKRAIKILKIDNETKATLSETEPYSYCLRCKAMFINADEGFYLD